MSFPPSIWDSNGTFGGHSLFQSNVPSSGNDKQQYSCWSPFGGSSSSKPMDFGNLNKPEEEMSEGIRALLEITRNFKNQSKFEDIHFAKVQESPSKSLVSNVAVNSLPSLQQAQLRITNLPHNRQSGNTGMNNYAMAVKRTLDQNKENTNNNNVILSTSSTAPLNGSINRGTNIQGEQPPRNKWFDKNIRSTVNAKETEGGPRINGRSIVNGINLNSLKFVKPARQCPRWDKPKHRIEEPNCPLWHPRERCQYYPRCRLTAEVCGFGHPFCGEYCDCAPEKRSLQMNHMPRKETN
ncbi:hypothetical protein Mgra_00007216 [Meloidogyne graminicola]|uniref:C3H1-type domain-containing protein n=1 Tax=Meloidogyne graminicola TaxID=189291 RepID=A0A8S9ZJG1_9BILA|nr:hypothetical protein Mgra_00007216 [Meloidogyne graminicola]